MAQRMFLIEPTHLRISRNTFDIGQDVSCRDNNMVRSAGDGMEFQHNPVVESAAAVNQSKDVTPQESNTSSIFDKGSSLKKSQEIVLSKDSIEELWEKMNPKSVPPIEEKLSFKQNIGEELHRFKLEAENLREVNEKLIDEKLRLSSQLGLQSQVNSDLKTLLVASIGEDLEDKFEQITLKRLITNEEMKRLLGELNEQTEKMENLQIHCDVWRSKFLASRVMVDQLGKWKHLMESRYRKCSFALEKLLQELDQIAQIISSSNRFLEQLTHLTGNSQFEDISSSSSTLDIAIRNCCLSKSLMQRIVNNSSSFYDVMGYDKINEISVTNAVGLSMAEEGAKKVLEDEVEEYPLKKEIDIESYDLMNEIRTARLPILFFPCTNCKGQLQIV